MPDDPSRAGADNSLWGMPHIPDARTATPAELARAAYERGDQLFQIDLVVSAIQGAVTNNAATTRTVRGDDADVLGAIEAEGWHLEHVSTSFVETGSVSVKRFFSDTGALVATHGHLIALYVFRRVTR